LNFSGIHITSLNKDVEWLMGFPFGLKTYRDLNILLGWIISNFIDIWYLK